MVYKRAGKGLDFGGQASLYKPLLSTPWGIYRTHLSPPNLPLLLGGGVVQKQARRGHSATHPSYNQFQECPVLLNFYFMDSTSFWGGGGGGIGKQA